MDALVKGLLQGSIPTIVLVGGTHYLVKGFKVSRPAVYWGSLAVAAGLTYAVVEGKIKVPFMNAEGDDLYYCSKCDEGFSSINPTDEGQFCDSCLPSSATLHEEMGRITMDAETFDAESFDNCPVCKEEVYGDMSMIGEEVIPDICGDCNIYIMPQGISCIECGFGDTYGSATPCESCETIAEKMEMVNKNAETFGAESSPIIWDSKEGQLIDPPMFTVWIGNDTEHFTTFEEALEFAKNNIGEDEEAQITISYYETLKEAETFEARGKLNPGYTCGGCMKIIETGHNSWEDFHKDNSAKGSQCPGVVKLPRKPNRNPQYAPCLTVLCPSCEGSPCNAKKHYDKEPNVKNVEKWIRNAETFGA